METIHIKTEDDLKKVRHEFINNRQVVFGFVLNKDSQYKNRHIIKPDIDWKGEKYQYIKIKNFVFKGKINLIRPEVEKSVLFENCEFHESVYFEGSSFKSDVNFRNCEFYDKIEFTNTNFDSQVIFDKVTFNEDIKFKDAEFKDASLFLDTVFEKNVMFLGAIFRKKIDIKRTRFKSGLDLSETTIMGEVTAFGLKEEDFYIKKVKYETAYSNKRETIRILKKAFLNQNNTIEYAKFSSMERNIHILELKKEKCSFNKIQSLSILYLNSISNNHGTSFFRGIIFTVFTSLIFFYFSLIATENFSFSFNDIEITEDVLKYYFTSLSLTHNVGFMSDENPNFFFYVWNFFERVFVSYGIFQTIQAFRKFR